MASLFSLVFAKKYCQRQTL